MTRVVCLWGEERGAKPTRLVYAMIFLIDTWRPVVCVVEVWQIDGNPVAIRWQFFRVPVVVVFVFAKFLGFQGSKLGFQGLEVDFRVNEPPRRSISGSRNLRGGSANLHPPSAAFFETSAKPPRTSDPKSNLRKTSANLGNPPHAPTTSAKPPQNLREPRKTLRARAAPRVVTSLFRVRSSSSLRYAVHRDYYVQEENGTFISICPIQSSHAIHPNFIKRPRSWSSWR